MSDMKTVEEWALAKGHRRLRADGSEDVCHAPLWKWRAARLAEQWPVGFEATEDEYDAAVRVVEGIEVRG